MYLVDTDVIIDVLRGVKGSKEFLLDMSNEGIFLSVISMAEIFSGKETRDPIKHEKILRFLSHFEVVPLTQDDALIAATAIHNGLTVVTHNTKHFEKVEGLKILKPSYR